MEQPRICHAEIFIRLNNGKHLVPLQLDKTKHWSESEKNITNLKHHLLHLQPDNYIYIYILVVSNIKIRNTAIKLYWFILSNIKLLANHLILIHFHDPNSCCFGWVGVPRIYTTSFFYNLTTTIKLTSVTKQALFIIPNMEVIPIKNNWYWFIVSNVKSFFQWMWVFLVSAPPPTSPT